jgi:micrococcal nuclease
LKNYFSKLLISSIAVFILTVTSACGLFYFDEVPAYKRSIETPLTETIYSTDTSGDTVIENETALHEQVLFKVTEVIDGDTFIIDSFERVRLIGINTPEDGMYFYEEAKQVLKIIAEGKMVELERDVTERDKYGRFLRYAFIKDLFINLEMVKRGFANVYTVPPDIKYQQHFLEAERYARDNSLGLWEISPYSFKSSSSSQEGTGAIIIRINYDAEGDDSKNMNDEYIIFFNNSGEDIDIEGWTVKDSGTNIYEFKKYIFKAGSEIFLFTGSGNDSENKFYWNSKMPVWNNSGDSLYLRDSIGLLVEMMSY